MEEEAEQKGMWKVGSEAELGSLKWPPRCYCCSFCGREFRSAQALGGHMNVHRKDRAKLKHNLDHVPINHFESRGSLVTRVAASSSPSPSSSSGSGFEGELVLKKQKLCVDFTMQFSTEKEGDQDRDGLKQSLQTETLVEMKEAATEEFDLELRL